MAWCWVPNTRLCAGKTKNRVIESFTLYTVFVFKGAESFVRIPCSGCMVLLAEAVICGLG